MSGEQRSLRDLTRHLSAVVPHGDKLPERQWESRHEALKWLLRAHIPAIFIISLLFDQGFWQAVLDGSTVGFFALLAQVRWGGRRAQVLVVTVGLLSCSALLVHITSGLNQSYFHFFVMVAALSLYEDWFPFVIAVVYVLIQQGITAEIVDYDHQNSPWRWALVHSAFVGALGLVCLATWRASERDRAAFRTLVESLEEGVVMIDRNAQVVASNPSAARILGVDPSELLLAGPEGLDWTVVDETGQAVAAHDIPLRVTARTGEPLAGVTYGLRHRRGDTLWLSLSTRAVEDTAEGPYTIVVSFTDITEEREAADALERSNTELQQFAYVASHDLSEPLRMVSSYLNLLRRRYQGRLDADADEFIDYAVGGANRMRTLIEALLEYSRAGNVDEPTEPVELSLVAADVLRSLTAAIIEASAEIELSDLPAVIGNRGQLEQLLQNLVANALKFRNDDRARVWVRAEPTNHGMAQIAVADGGIGIAPESRESVFEMFGRLHDRETYEGTGIGLAVCRKIVERHGGRIWVDEREGGGTVFRFTLPLA